MANLKAYELVRFAVALSCILSTNASSITESRAASRPINLRSIFRPVVEVHSTLETIFDLARSTKLNGAVPPFTLNSRSCGVPYKLFLQIDEDKSMFSFEYAIIYPLLCTNAVSPHFSLKSPYEYNKISSCRQANELNWHPNPSAISGSPVIEGKLHFEYTAVSAMI